MIADHATQSVRATRGEFETELGDVTDPDVFHPQIKVKRWANEVAFSARFVSTAPATVAITPARVTWTTATLRAELFPLEGEEGGGFEFLVELFERPASNVLTWTLRSRGLRFYYQPLAITEWEKRRFGNPVRPDHVAGSYAVYHRDRKGNYTATGGHNYRSGKAFHLFRPWAEDARGVRVWCVLHIDAGHLTITVPADFLAGAAYPVRVDPTFGYTSIPATEDTTMTTNGYEGYSGTPASSGFVDDVQVYTRSPGSAPIKPLIILGSTKTLVTDGVGPAFTIPTNVAAWRTVPYSVKPAVSSGVAYFAAFIAGGQCSLFYDTGVAGAGEIFGGTAIGSYASPSSPTDGTVDTTTHIGVYANYSAGGSTPKRGGSLLNLGVG